MEQVYDFWTNELIEELDNQKFRRKHLRYFNQIFMMQVVDFYSMTKNYSDKNGEIDISFNEITVINVDVEGKVLDNFISAKSLYTNVLFKKTSLYSAYLVQTVFRNCKFINVEFTKANLTQVVFDSCIFDNCSFFRAEIIDSEIKNTAFTDCNFSNIIFSENRIVDSKFNISDRSNSVISENEEVNTVWSFK